MRLLLFILFLILSPKLILSKSIAKLPDTLSLNEYLIQLNTILKEAEIAIEEQQAFFFHKFAKKLPDEWLVSMPPGHGTLAFQRVSNNWIQNYFHHQLPDDLHWERYHTIQKNIIKRETAWKEGISHQTEKEKSESENDFDYDDYESNWDEELVPDETESNPDSIEDCEDEEYKEILDKWEEVPSPYVTSEDSLLVLGFLVQLLKNELNEKLSSSILSSLDGATAQEAQRILADNLYRYKIEKPDTGHNQEENYEEKESIIPDLRLSFRKLFSFFIVFLLIGFLAYLMFRMQKLIDFRKTTRIETLNLPGGLLKAEDPKESSALAKAAQKKINENDYPTALRYLYLSYVVLLHEKKKIYYNPSYTNWEYHKRMTQLGLSKNESYFITQLFDETHYGLKPVNEASFTLFQSDIETLSNQVQI